jgi:ABC-type multidrug transport system ATPase subunit
MIQLKKITKEYRTGWISRRDRVRALDGLDLEVPMGSGLGLVGLNGAGKSTLIRILLGYARPTAGEVLLNDLPPRRYAERHGIAYVPERVTIPPSWTVRSALQAYAMLGNLENDAWDRVEAAIDRLGLEPLASRRIGALSKGNLQRVGIAQAILAPRKLMVLDEPSDGLDPLWIAEMRTVIREWREADPERILIMASHNLPEVERLTDRIILLHNGRLEAEFATGQSADLEQWLLSTLPALQEARV